MTWQPSCAPAWVSSAHDAIDCRSGLVSRGVRSGPRVCVALQIAGAALRPFRDTRPLLLVAVLLNTNIF